MIAPLEKIYQGWVTCKTSCSKRASFAAMDWRRRVISTCLCIDTYWHVFIKLFTFPPLPPKKREKIQFWTIQCLNAKVGNYLFRTCNCSSSLSAFAGKPFQRMSFFSFWMISMAMSTFNASYTRRRIFFSSYVCRYRCRERERIWEIFESLWKQGH